MPTQETSFSSQFRCLTQIHWFPLIAHILWWWLISWPVINKWRGKMFYCLCSSTMVVPGYKFSIPFLLLLTPFVVFVFNHRPERIISYKKGLDIVTECQTGLLRVADLRIPINGIKTKGQQEWMFEICCENVKYQIVTFLNSKSLAIGFIILPSSTLFVLLTFRL